MVRSATKRGRRSLPVRNETVLFLKEEVYYLREELSKITNAILQLSKQSHTNIIDSQQFQRHHTVPTTIQPRIQPESEKHEQSRNEASEQCNQFISTRLMQAYQDIPVDTIADDDAFVLPRRPAPSSNARQGTWGIDISNTYGALSAREEVVDNCMEQRNTDVPLSRPNTPERSRNDDKFKNVSHRKRNSVIPPTEKYLANNRLPVRPGEKTYSAITAGNMHRNTVAGDLHNSSASGKSRDPAGADTGYQQRAALKVTVFGDSITKRIATHTLSTKIENGGIVKNRSHPGAISERLAKHVNIELEYGTPDIAIVHAGSNDLSDKIEIPKVVDNIQSIAYSCITAGTKTVLISGMTPRMHLRNEIPALNDALRKMCRENGLYFIDNGNILYGKMHMAYDRIHLNDKGREILIDNYSSSINDILSGL